jgi:spore germination protein GerM
LCLGALAAGSMLSACRSNIIPPDLKRVPIVEGGQTAGEQPDNAVSASMVQVYYLDAANQRVVAEEYNVQAFLNERTVRSLFSLLRQEPSGEDLTAAIDPDTALLRIDFRSDIINVDVSRSFYDSPDPVAARVALVNTLTALEGVNYVKITVEGRDLTYEAREGEDGLPVGPAEAYPNDLAQVRVQDREKLLEAGQIVERELYFRDISGMYLLPEIRTIRMDGRSVPALLLEALTQGPSDIKGLYPVLPADVQVLDSRVEGEQATLYMSNSFIQTQAGTGNLEQYNLSIRVASLVLTITSLSDVSSVKFYYEDGEGGYMDDAVAGIDFTQPMYAEDYTSRIGRRIVVYFADEQSTMLIPEYRAVERDNRVIEKAVINALTAGPLESGNTGVIPDQLKELGISASLDQSSSVVMVDLPAGFDGSSLSSTAQLMLIYSIVNSLTDPMNLATVTQVRFTVGGQIAETFGGVDISQPLTRNTSLIQQ